MAQCQGPIFSPALFVAVTTNSSFILTRARAPAASPGPEFYRNTISLLNLPKPPAQSECSPNKQRRPGTNKSIVGLASACIAFAARQYILSPCVLPLLARASASFAYILLPLCRVARLWLRLLLRTAAISLIAATA